MQQFQQLARSYVDSIILWNCLNYRFCWIFFLDIFLWYIILWPTLDDVSDWLSSQYVVQKTTVVPRIWICMIVDSHQNAWVRAWLDEAVFVVFALITHKYRTYSFSMAAILLNILNQLLSLRIMVLADWPFSYDVLWNSFTLAGENPYWIRMVHFSGENRVLRKISKSSKISITCAHVKYWSFVTSDEIRESCKKTFHL